MEFSIHSAGQVLYPRYKEIRSGSARATCKKLGLKVETDAFLPVHARLYKKDDGLTVQYLPTSLPPLRDFLIYHELAHHFLLESGITCPNSAPMLFGGDGEVGYRTQERWCDNFALSIVLWSQGIMDIGTMESYKEFLKDTAFPSLTLKRLYHKNERPLPKTLRRLCLALDALSSES